jgi:hypothetical protein
LGHRINGTIQPPRHEGNYQRCPRLGKEERRDVEAEKTAIIHFTRKLYKIDAESFTIKGQMVQPKDHIKVLGVIMDTKLKYWEHIAKAATKGLEAVMELKRRRGLSPATARQLLSATVTPVVDYASNVWMHKCSTRRQGLSTGYRT